MRDRWTPYRPYCSNSISDPPPLSPGAVPIPQRRGLGPHLLHQKWRRGAPGAPTWPCTRRFCVATRLGNSRVKIPISGAPSYVADRLSVLPPISMWSKWVIASQAGTFEPRHGARYGRKCPGPPAAPHEGVRWRQLRRAWLLSQTPAGSSTRLYHGSGPREGGGLHSVYMWTRRMNKIEG
jgi:hypothetical protein